MNASTRLLRVVAIACATLITGQLFAIEVASTHQIHLDARSVQVTQTVSKELLDRVPGPRGGSLEWLRAVGPLPSTKLGGGTPITIKGLSSGGSQIILDGIQFNFSPKVAEGGTSIGMNIIPMSAVEGIQVAPYRSTVTVPNNSSLLIGYQTPSIQDSPTKFVVITPTISQSPSSPSTQVVTAPTSSYTYSKWEFGAAYAHMQADEEVVSDLHGFTLTGYYNFNRNVAVGVQFGGYYASKDIGFDEEMFLDRYSFLAGPRLQCGGDGPVRPYGQVMFGAVHDSVGVEFNGNYYSSSDTAFGMTLGVGVNFEVTQHLTITPSVDWFPTFFDDRPNTRQDNWRLGIGLNWRF